MESKQLVNELMESIENGGLYDYIANNYYKMSKEQLKEIILELDYAIYNRVSNYQDFEKQAIEEMKERI